MSLIIGSIAQAAVVAMIWPEIAPLALFTPTFFWLMIAFDGWVAEISRR